MTEQLLTKEDFNKIANNVAQYTNGGGNLVDAINAYSTALYEIERLRNERNFQRERADKNGELSHEWRNKFERIVEVESELRKEIDGLKHDVRVTKKAYNELHKHLAEFEEVEMDTREEAEKKAFEKWRKYQRGASLRHCENKNAFQIIENDWPVEFFDYAVERQPEVGDIMVFKKGSVRVLFTIGPEVGKNSEFYFDSISESRRKQYCTPTPYRFDGEKIVRRR